MKVKTQEVRDVISILDEIIEQYKEDSVEKKRRQDRYCKWTYDDMA